MGLFLIFPIHLLKIFAKSQPGYSYKICSYKEKKHVMGKVLYCAKAIAFGRNINDSLPKTLVRVHNYLLGSFGQTNPVYP